MQSGKTCPNPITTATECFTAAGNTFTAANHTHREASDPTQPAGCSAVAGENGSVQVLFNKATSSVQCGSGATTLIGEGTDVMVGVTVGVEMDLTKKAVTLRLRGPDKVWFAAGFNATAMKQAPWALVVDGTGKVSEHRLADQGAPPTTGAILTLFHAVVTPFKGGFNAIHAIF